MRETAAYCGGADYRALFEAAPGLFLALAPDLTIVAATDEYLAATMTVRDEILGRGIFEVFPDDPADVSADGTLNLRASLERVRATRAPDTMAVQKYDVRGPDGSFQRRYWSPKNVPILSPSGALRYIMHRVEDVSELAQADERGEALSGRARDMEKEVLARSRELARANRDLHAANQRLAELDAAKTAFFANVSHEFRTPLTLMLGPLEDALSGPAQSLTGEALRMTHRNAVRLSALVGSLLDFTRIESGRMEATFEPTDLAALTVFIAGSFGSASHRLGLRFDVVCDELSEPVYVDPHLWERVVLNLLSNALKHTFEGGIDVSLRLRGPRVELAVRDTGVGIPEDELPRIFERFHRVAGARSRTHEGSGIGLAMVRDLVRLHGGDLEVSSQVGVGSTFTASIPRGAAHLPPGRVAAASAPPRGPISATPSSRHLIAAAGGWSHASEPPRDAPAAPPPDASERVLVVDDNADMREYIRGLLCDRWAVEVARDGLEALEAARRQRPTLIVSDVMMPRLDGFGLLRALRADPTLRDVRFILLSAHAAEGAAIEGLEAGADDYVAKPFAARELIARVRTHVELVRQRELMERFFTLSLDMMCVAGADGRFKRLSPSFDALGYSREELHSRPFLEFVHPDDREATARVFEALGQGVSAVQFENRYLCRDGSTRWLAWSVAPDADCVYAIARDATEARLRSEELARARDAAEEANRELESFSYSVAHDLRAPLRGIDGFSRALAEDCADKLDEEGRSHLAFIRASAGRMAQLIDDLLALSRVTRSELNLQDVDLSALARESIGALQSRHPGRRVEAVVEDQLTSRGDVRLLQVVLDNLLDNAWKFTANRGDARVEFGAVERDGRPVYLVRDNGAGFDMAFAHKLFGAFQRLHSSTEFEGTGIGLATVRRVVSRHGGRVWAEGAVGRGATFYFNLHEQDHVV